MADHMQNKPFDARLAFKLVYPLRDSRITPNHLTLLRLLFGIFAATGFVVGNYFWENVGAACFVISNFLDHTDGELARLTGKISKTGHIFDLACDAIVNIMLFVGIGVGLMDSKLGLWALPMGIISGLSVATIFHMRYEIEIKIGKTSARQPHYGWIEAEDVLYLLPVITLMQWLVPFLSLAAIGAPAFAILVLCQYRKLRFKKS
ncbi:MAG: CDP-alcohol phosphatidyltransferase family protein [Gammaproteobacteria bacterium]